MFLARSQWKHLRDSTEVESMDAKNTSTAKPNIFFTKEIVLPGI